MLENIDYIFNELSRNPLCVSDDPRLDNKRLLARLITWAHPVEVAEARQAVDGMLMIPDALSTLYQLTLKHHNNKCTIYALLPEVIQLAVRELVGVKWKLSSKQVHTINQIITENIRGQPMFIEI